MSTTSFFSAFNAKAMSYEQIVGSFVSSSKFNQLAGQWNALLVGPRGSGKTTLLRMLSLEAMRVWSGPEADQFRSELNYTGIYVPADLAWGEMIRSLISKLGPESSELIAEAAFVTNAMMSTLRTIQQRVQIPLTGEVRLQYRFVQMSSADQGKLAMELASIWKLQLRSASLLSLQNSLAERLLDIGQQANLLAHRSAVNQDELCTKLPYLGLPFVECVNQAISAFDRFANEDDGVWALLLDEFEVAPNHLQSVVLTALRGGTTKLLFKAALAPCGPHTLMSLSTPTPPTAKDDFRQIELWYPDKGEAEGFCARVFKSRVASFRDFSDLRPEQVFGRSAYAIVDEEGNDQSDAQNLRSDRWVKDFKALKARDESFAYFIQRKKISVDELDPSDSAPAGTLIRKIAPIVAFRNAYKGFAEGKKRGRKAFNSAYSGWSAIAAMSEGNPRWLIGLLSGIFSEGSKLDSLPISIPVQHTHATETAWTFANVLKTVAISQYDQIKTQRPIFELLMAIGKFFHERLVTSDFMEDPPMSFIVDDDVDIDIENCLRIAINHGAIVCYQSTDGIGGFDTLRGKRFRLSYLLSPCFKLPVRKSKPIHLSTILNTKAQSSKPLDEMNDSPQGSLF
jgi:energy-coupling factor transporter ATP-binding protein EcfA2